MSPPFLSRVFLTHRSSDPPLRTRYRTATVRRRCSTSGSSARSRSSPRPVLFGWGAEAAGDARDPAPEREPRRLGRTARGRPLRRRRAGHGRDAGAAADLGAAQEPGRAGSRPGPGYVLRLSPTARPGALRAPDGGGGAARRAESAPPLPTSCARRSRSGAAPPLADLAYESFAQPAIARLEELRLAAVEQRIDAELALGRHAELVGELEALVARAPAPGAAAARS